MQRFNPFSALLADALEAEGCVVEPFSLRRVLATRYDIIILHWPAIFSTQFSLPVAWVRTAVFLTLMTWQRLRGAYIVRIVHDVTDLKANRARLLAINGALSSRFMNAYVFLSASSKEAFLASAPREARKTGALLFHPRFEANSPALSCAVPPGGGGLRFVGDLKPYKGLHVFLERAMRTGCPVKLEIFGVCDEPAYEAQLDKAVAAANAAGSAIVWHKSRPDHGELDALVDGAGAVLLPYLVGWNSGMAIKVLERGVPIVTSDLGVFAELEADLGADWVRRLPADDDTAFAARLSALPVPDSAARTRLAGYLATLSWQRFADGVLALYRDRRHS
ncbi:MAG: glycosyltransferase [Hyphomonas sp.]|nr:glycosyltransferase [Hyphomonas sp.]